MPAYLTPLYIKPRSKILSWTLPMVFVEERKEEFISDYPGGNVVIKETVKAFKNYHEMTMTKDIRGNPERYKIYVDIASMYEVPVEEFVSRATEDKEIARLNMTLNLLSADSYKQIGKIYNSLDRDLRVMITQPTQWLVYARRERILTRLCWIIKLEGEIILRPYGLRSLLLEVDSVLMDRVNEPSLRTIKKNAILKQRLNDYWKRLVTSEVAGEELKSLQETLSEALAETSESSREETGMVGEVE